MNASIDEGGTVASNPGDSVPHLPVLYQEVLDALLPTSGCDYLDGTLGAGGHAEGILRASAPDGRLLGLDLDPEALKIARLRLADYQPRVIIQQASYQNSGKILTALGWGSVQGILLDLGVSSMQVDRPYRGFSFMEEGPLDMRFDPESQKPAADLVNNLDADDLADIIFTYGEERHARRIARAIVNARPIMTTQALAQVIEQAVVGYGGKIHPATRTFQALRIATNNELEVLSTALSQLVDCLSVGGRLAIISFHSLEDRIVKQFFRRESQDCICPPEQPVCTCEHVASLTVLTRKPLRATTAEIATNPRSRSAKLRVAERIK